MVEEEEEEDGLQQEASTGSYGSSRKLINSLSNTQLLFSLFICLFKKKRKRKVEN